MIKQQTEIIEDQKRELFSLSIAYNKFPANLLTRNNTYYLIGFYESDIREKLSWLVLVQDLSC